MGFNSGFKELKNNLTRTVLKAAVILLFQTIINVNGIFIHMSKEPVLKL